MKRKAEVQDKIKEILIKELEIQPVQVQDVNTDTPLLGRGIGLDSMETLTLVTGIEQEFGVQVEDDELTTGLFQTLGTLTDFVISKLGDT
jgi:acyl carrier protein